ncbi:MAG: hypothetical protein E6Q95_00335, partial [Chitinophagaceae bacterium]
IIMLVISFASCSKQNMSSITMNETDSLQKLTTFKNTTHQVDIYTKSGKLQQGYNKIYFQVKDINQQLVQDITANWLPMMHMTSMSHSGPHSTIQKVANSKGLYEGYIVFQMAGNESEYWDLTINYTIDNHDFTVKEKLIVPAFSKRNVVTFTGTDNQSYIIALVQPQQPKVAVNDIQAMVFKKQDMMNYPVVNGYTIKIDPRMPSMGNHGTPNNIDLTQTQINGIYQGKLSLTMTGYWKINLQLLNDVGTLLKGETVNSETESSSIFFEIEF